MTLLSYVFIAFVAGETLAWKIRPKDFGKAASCSYKGKTYSVGKFRPSPCEYCECTNNGRAICAQPRCSQPPCVDYVNKPDICCPVCPNGPNCSYKDHIIKQGETYRPDAYTMCTCPSKPSFGGSLSAVCKSATQP